MLLGHTFRVICITIASPIHAIHVSRIESSSRKREKNSSFRLSVVSLGPSHPRIGRHRQCNHVKSSYRSSVLLRLRYTLQLYSLAS